MYAAVTFVAILLINRSEVLGQLTLAFLIWLYFPLCVAMGFLQAAIGCDEGPVTLEHFRWQLSSLAVLTCSFAILVTTVWLTVSYLRAVSREPATSVKRYLRNSILFQLVLTPMLVAALAFNSRAT